MCNLSPGAALYSTRFPRVLQGLQYTRLSGQHTRHLICFGAKAISHAQKTIRDSDSRVPPTRLYRVQDYPFTLSTSFMPVCFCTVRGCRDSGGVDPASGKPFGRTVTANVLRAHSLDQLAHETNHELNCDVEDDEIEQLTSKIAGTTLADQMNGPATTVPGGRLWGHYFSKAESPLPTSPFASHIPRENVPSLSSNQDTPPRSREVELLRCLSSLDIDINAFVDEVELDVGQICLPSSKEHPEPFPLQTLITKFGFLQSRLDTVSFKSPAVKLRKECLETKLAAAGELLQNARCSWDVRLKKIQKVKTPSKGVHFDTCQCRHSLRFFKKNYNLILAHHYTPILLGADPVLQVSFFMIITCQVILGVSRRGCNFLLQMTQYIINLVILRAGSNIPQRDQKLLSDIPTDFRRTEEQFHLKTQLHCCCCMP